VTSLILTQLFGEKAKQLSAFKCNIQKWLPLFTVITS